MSRIVIKIKQTIAITNSVKRIRCLPLKRSSPDISSFLLDIRLAIFPMFINAITRMQRIERIQVFEGTVLKRQGGGARETFTVRKTSNGIGVEKTWPVHSPHVERVEVVRRGKVRRAKLNYLRQRVGKAAKVKELVK